MSPFASTNDIVDAIRLELHIIDSEIISLFFSPSQYGTLRRTMGLFFSLARLCCVVVVVVGCEFHESTSKLIIQMYLAAFRLLENTHTHTHPEALTYSNFN